MTIKSIMKLGRSALAQAAIGGGLWYTGGKLRGEGGCSNKICKMKS